MLKIEFLPSVGKPDLEKAAELLAPIIQDIWEEEQIEKLSRQPQQPDYLERGDSVA